MERIPGEDCELCWERNERERQVGVLEYVDSLAPVSHAYKQHL